MTRVRRDSKWRFMKGGSTDTQKAGVGYWELDNEPVQSAISGDYICLPNGVFSTSNALGNGDLRLVPKFFPSDCSFQRIGTGITVVGDTGCVLRLAHYHCSLTAFRPDRKGLDLGTIPGDAVAEAYVSGTFKFRRGWHWFGAALQGVTSVQPTVRVYSNLLEPSTVDFSANFPVSTAYGYRMTGQTGALPGTFVNSGYPIGASPIIWGRLT